MEMNRPSLVSNPHPLIGAGRELTFEPFKERETLRAFMRRTNIAIPNHECAVWHNGHRVPDKLWPYLIPRAGDQIIIRARVHGGGGGGKIIKTVATIALVITAIVVAPYLAPALAGAIGTSVAVATQLAAAAIMIGGSLLINALIPLPRVGEQSGFTGTQLPSIGISAPSMSAAKYGSIGGVGSMRAFDINPTYAIAGGKNRARLWEAMGIVFGRHKIVPDLAANSYTQYIGADQYLNQAFHLGLQGEGIDIDELSIGDTPLANYKGIDIQRAQADGELTMFPLNVDTIQGFNVQNADSWTQRTTPINTTHIDIELASQLYYFQDDGGQFV